MIWLCCFGYEEDWYESARGESGAMPLNGREGSWEYVSKDGLSSSNTTDVGL